MHIRTYHPFEESITAAPKDDYGYEMPDIKEMSAKEIAALTKRQNFRVGAHILPRFESLRWMIGNLCIAILRVF